MGIDGWQRKWDGPNQLSRPSQRCFTQIDAQRTPATATAASATTIPTAKATTNVDCTGPCHDTHGQQLCWRPKVSNHTTEQYHYCQCCWYQKWNDASSVSFFFLYQGTSFGTDSKTSHGGRKLIHPLTPRIKGGTFEPKTTQAQAHSDSNAKHKKAISFASLKKHDQQTGQRRSNLERIQSKN